MKGPEKQPIETAPRDGTIIWIHHDDVGSFVCRWNPVGSNAIFQPEPTGIWEAPLGQFTWSEDEGNGPSHWWNLNPQEKLYYEGTPKSSREVN